MSVVFQAWHGRYLCAEPGGHVIADRVTEGEWETWQEDYTDGKVAFRSAHGTYLCAEPDGRLVHRTPGTADTLPGEWEHFTPVRTDGKSAFRTAHGTYVVAEPDFTMQHRMPGTETGDPGAWEYFTVRGDITLPPRLVRPVQGYVRTEGRRWADDSGLRVFRICSWFPALRCYRDHPEAAREQLVDIAKHWQGVRIFWHVWTARWGNPTYSVDPRWPDFDSLFVSFLRDCAALDLRVSLSCGDMQDLCPDGDERPWHAHIASLVASVDQHTVSWWGIWNEGWQNSWHGFNDDDKGHAYAREMSRMIQGMYPWGAHALTDTDEEPNNLDHWSVSPSNHVMIHGLRGWPDCVRRPFNTELEGNGWLVNNDEPNGDGPDVYVGESDPRRLFAQYTMHLFASQMTTFFGGHALRSWTPDRRLDRDWGFRQLPALWAAMDIPDNIASWSPIPGHWTDAAIYAETFEVPHGEGPHRCDNFISSDGQHAVAIVYAGTGMWRIRSRWSGHAKIWSASGLIAEHDTVSGQRFLQMNSSEQAVVIQLNR